MIRVTAKLREAAELLAGERFADTSAAAVLSVITDPNAVYLGLRKMGYRWNDRQGRWFQRRPAVIKNVIRAAERVDILSEGD